MGRMIVIKFLASPRFNKRDRTRGKECIVQIVFASRIVKIHLYVLDVTIVITHFVMFVFFRVMVLL